MSRYPTYIDSFKYDFTNKDKNIKETSLYDLTRLSQMFKYKGLPDTIPQRDLELLNMTRGFSAWIKKDDNVYALMGGLGGELNYNYMPKKAIIANPYVPIEGEFDIDVDCVVMPNDSLYMGVMPILNKYNAMLAENELTIHILTVISRVRDFLVANDDKAKQSAEKYIDDLFKGKIGVIAEQSFMDNIRALATSSGVGSSKPFSEFIENEQYFKASKFNELGLKSQFNMKREALNSSETDLNNSILLPFVDDMMDNRKKAIEKINKMFGLNITIEFNSAWEELEEITEEPIEEGSINFTHEEEGGNNDVQEVSETN